MTKQAQAQYRVTSKPGMTPWSTPRTLREARRDSREARRQGLDGAIYKGDVRID